jgi:hypothetical protein
MPVPYLFKKTLPTKLLPFLILILPGLFFFPLQEVVQGTTSGDIAWRNIETKYTMIHYQSFEDLERFNDKVDYAQDRWGLKRLFSSSGSDNLIDKLNKKVDVLFERVQEILDMRKEMKKVTIKIYHDRRQLHDAYSRIYKKPCRFRAWYIYEYNTIYINVDDLNEGMLAHEMAHSIIDHYLSVRPPSATAEILARYVHSHLL